MSEKGTSGGIGMLGALQILFVGLKLSNIINWNWLFVLSPSLIGLCIMVVLLCISIFFTIIEIVGGRN